MDANNKKAPRLSPIVVFAIWLLVGLLAICFVIFGAASDSLQGKIVGISISMAILVGGYVLIRKLKKMRTIYEPGASDPATPATPVFPVTESAAAHSQANLAKIGGGLLSGALAIYAFYQLFLLSPIAGQLLQPESQLEKVTMFGVSRKADIDQFQDAGGLNSSPAWHGLYVISMQSQYRASGDTLSALSLVVSGKAKWVSSISKWMPESQLSTKDLRNILSGICGVAEGDWKFTDGNMSYGVVETPTTQCAYSPALGNGQTIFVSKK